MNILGDIKVIYCIGSCLSHDFIVNNFDKSIEIKYSWRTGTPALVSAPMADISFIDSITNVDSELKTLKSDFSKKPNVSDLINQSDLIIIDLVRDTYPLLLHNGSIFTYGVEAEKYEINKRLNESRIIHYNTLEHFEHFYKSLELLSFQLRRDNKPIVLIGGSYSHFSYNHHDNKIELLEHKKHHEIFVRARYLYLLEKLFTTYFPEITYVPFPNFIQNLDKKHVWGYNPVHYSSLTFPFIFDELKLKLKIENPVNKYDFFAAKEKSKIIYEAYANYFKSGYLKNYLY